MKKILCIILVFLLFLVSCKKSTSISPVITDISFTAEASINNEISKYETVIKYKDDNILIELSDLSSGITFSFYDGKLTEKLYNIENKTDISSLSALSVPELIYFIINDITQNNKLIKSDDNFVGTGKVTAQGSTSPENVLSVSTNPKITYKNQYKTITTNINQ